MIHSTIQPRVPPNAAGLLSDTPVPYFFNRDLVNMPDSNKNNKNNRVLMLEQQDLASKIIILQPVLESLNYFNAITEKVQ